jgi:hypothetical protein
MHDYARNRCPASSTFRFTLKPCGRFQGLLFAGNTKTPGGETRFLKEKNPGRDSGREVAAKIAQKNRKFWIFFRVATMTSFILNL